MIRDKRQYLREQCEKYPDNPTHHRKLAEALIEDGLHGEAMEVYRSCAKLTPEDPRIWHQLGVCCRNVNLTTDAIEAFRQAIQRAPNYASAYRQMGLCLLDLEMGIEASGFLEAAIKLSPRIEGTRIPLARAYETQERFEDALTQYQLEHELNPKNWKIRWRQAQLFLQLGNIIESYHILQEIYPLTRNQLEAEEIRDLLRHVRQLVRESGSLDETDEFTDDASDENSSAADQNSTDSTPDEENLAPIESIAGNPLRSLQRAILQEPSRADLRIALAEAHVTREEWPAAVESFRKAVTILQAGRTQNDEQG